MGRRDLKADKVLLALLPLSSAHYPSLALGLLKPAVAALGLRCDVRYFSLDYLEEIGAESFERLDDTAYYTALVGEWVFAAAAHGEEEAAGSAGLRYLTEVLEAEFPEHYRAPLLLTLLAARRGAAAFIERCVGSIDWTRVSVLGVSTSFQQNMASLAFARRVKERHPHVLVVFGGANCQGEMGVELHRRYPFIDAICLGEGDRVFPELVRRHLAGERAVGLPGLVLRDSDGASLLPLREVDQVEDMDRLPLPDLSDFYAQHRASPVAEAEYPTAVVFETARGCWWGAKHHCSFCGLNGRMMSYRSKSPARAFEELARLTRLHGRDVITTDAILDLRYFDELLPRIAASDLGVTMFWQMKANLRPEQLTLLARAGVKRIQPGIEALDTELLTLMNKGCTMLHNVQLLKLAAENGLSVAWNLLYGFPGADPAAYRRAARIMPMLRHLQPPDTTGRALADRFSPYFQRPESFGVALEPASAYGFIHPFGAESVARLAYHFHMRSDALDAVEEHVEPMLEEQRLWSAHQGKSALYCEESGADLVVTDRRWGWPRSRRRLSGAEAALLRLCWQITAWHRIEARLGPEFGPASLTRAAALLEERGLLLREGEECLALPLRQPGWRRAPTWDEVLDGTVTPYALRNAARVPLPAAPLSLHA
jgi:ribosomal peptide maturation radical SAM protein 1